MIRAQRVCSISMFFLQLERIFLNLFDCRLIVHYKTVLKLKILRGEDAENLTFTKCLSRSLESSSIALFLTWVTGVTSKKFTQMAWQKWFKSGSNSKISTIRPCMKYCCHVWAGAPSCYLELLDKLQKRICRTVSPSRAASLEPLAQCRNVASLGLFYRYYFGICSSELAQLVPLPYSREDLLVILIDCMIFLSPFLNITMMSMSAVSFLTRLDSGILRL